MSIVEVFLSKKIFLKIFCKYMIFENREFYKNIFFVSLIPEWNKIGYFVMLMKNTLTLFERVFFYFAAAIFLKNF